MACLAHFQGPFFILWFELSWLRFKEIFAQAFLKILIHDCRHDIARSPSYQVLPLHCWPFPHYQRQWCSVRSFKNLHIHSSFVKNGIIISDALIITCAPSVRWTFACETNLESRWAASIVISFVPAMKSTGMVSAHICSSVRTGSAPVMGLKSSFEN